MTRVVILGGGFGGLAAAQELAGRCQVTLVDRRKWFEYLPAIHELVSGVKKPEHLRLPLAELVARMGHRFLLDEVARIEPDNHRIDLVSGGSLPYDLLIMALGGVDATQRVTGARDHARFFKSVDDCAGIGSRLAELAGKNRVFDVVVVGGGLEGVETLGEILRRFRSYESIRIHLVDGARRLLRDAPPEVDRHLRSLIQPYGVELLLQERVIEVTEGTVRLHSGREIPSDLTIWTGGIGPPPVLERSGLTGGPGEWLEVGQTLQSIEQEGLFGVGDLVSLPGGLSKQAYHALDMGRLAARNLERLVAGRSLLPFVPSAKPMLLSFGDLSGYLIWEGKVLEGTAVNLAKESVYQLVMGRFDPPSPRRSLGRLGSRLAAAGRELVWPTLSSVGRLVGMGRLRVLAWR
ncbi:MAG: FAD-dependent oxidoreductase [Bradymonadales bacterium]|nr:FAD-dependent oxidoreductase [Bradymonadales bacterium]